MKTQWMNVSDLMTGLMIVFMFIAISYMVKINNSDGTFYGKIEEFGNLEQELNDDLQEEFKSNLKSWGATITADNTVRFEGPVKLTTISAPEILFPQGASDIGGDFETALSDFFPRYIDILTQDKYREYVEEVRIEGHTSSEWTTNDLDVRYLENARLSQLRSFSVLEFCLDITHPIIRNSRLWLIDTLRANGASFSRPINSHGDVVRYSSIESGQSNEDRTKSRRVDFRVMTALESTINAIYSRNRPSGNIENN